MGGAESVQTLVACRTVPGVKVSTRGDYASRALLSLALHAEESGPTSVRDIAERTGLPQPYLEQILLALKGAGIVRSKRGVGGGYVLAREPSQITLGEIVSAVDGPIARRRLRRAPPGRRLRPRGPVRAARGVGRHQQPDPRATSTASRSADIAAMARGQADWPEPDLARAEPRAQAAARVDEVGGQRRVGTTAASPVTGWASSRRLGVEERAGHRAATGARRRSARRRPPGARSSGGGRGSGGCGRSRACRRAR